MLFEWNKWSWHSCKQGWKASVGNTPRVAEQGQICVEELPLDNMAEMLSCTSTLFLNYI